MTIELDEEAQKFIEQSAKNNPGIPAERFIAFTIPSLMNGKRVPARGIRADMTDRLKDTSSHIR
jgi:hypothetical protein